MYFCNQRSRSRRRMYPGRRSRSRFQRDCKHSPSEVNRNPAGPKDSTSKKPFTANIFPTTALRSFNDWYLSSCGFYIIYIDNSEKHKYRNRWKSHPTFIFASCSSPFARFYLVNVLQICQIGLYRNDSRCSIIRLYKALQNLRESRQVIVNTVRTRIQRSLTVDHNRSHDTTRQQTAISERKKRVHNSPY